jgi:transcription elongation factor Elf1
MGKTERRAHLNKTTNLEFMEFIRKKAPKDSDSFSKKIIMDWSFVNQNIIPGWHLEGRDPEKRGHFKLSLLEEAFKRVESGGVNKTNAKEEFKKARAAAKAERDSQKKTEKTPKKAPVEKPKKTRKTKAAKQDEKEVLTKTVYCPKCKTPREMTQVFDSSANEFITKISCEKCGKNVEIRTTNKKAGQELAEIEFVDETIDDNFDDLENIA